MFEPISIPNKSPSAVVVKHTNVSNPGLRALNTRKSVLKYPFATKWICYSVLEKGMARRAGLIYRVNVTVNGGVDAEEIERKREFVINMEA